MQAYQLQLTAGAAGDVFGVLRNCVECSGEAWIPPALLVVVKNSERR